MPGHCHHQVPRSALHSYRETTGNILRKTPTPLWTWGPLRHHMRVGTIVVIDHSCLLCWFLLFFPPLFNESKMYIARQIIGRRFRPLPAGRGAFSDGNGDKRFERNLFLCHYFNFLRHRWWCRNTERKTV